MTILQELLALENKGADIRASKDEGLPPDPNQSPRELEDGTKVGVGDTVETDMGTGVVKSFGGDEVRVMIDGEQEEFDISEIIKVVKKAVDYSKHTRDVSTKESITEGFMGLSVTGSDRASDLNHELVSAMVKVLTKGMKDKGNEFNTPGYLNVAMIMVEHLPSFSNTYHEGLESLRVKVVEEMEAKKKDWTEESGASAGLKKQYDSILAKLKRIKFD